MLAKRPEERFASMDEVVAALEAGLRPPAPADWQDRLAPWLRGTTLWIALASAAVVLVALAHALVR